MLLGVVTAERDFNERGIYMRMLVLGAGAQGSSCAYDLLNNQEVTLVGLADLKVDRVAPFLQKHVGDRLQTIVLDVTDSESVNAVISGYDCVLSALPYYLNLEVSRIAVKNGVHFCDLGGNTEIVLGQKEFDTIAKRNGVSAVVDCGLAPGMVNILAQHGIDMLDSVNSVRMYVGGLPANPVPPLNYQVVYSLEGALDYYTTDSWVLQNGAATRVKALSDVERVDFDEPIGELEAFHTAGGLSTMASRYDGRINRMEYKTLRYPGHARIMSAIRELGFLDTTPLDVKGQQVVPRDLTVSVMNRALKKPDSPDIVVLRVIVNGIKDGQGHTVTFELVDRYDAQTGLSAMMRVTGFSLSITGQMQVMRLIASGVHTSDEAVPPTEYIAALKERGIVVNVLETSDNA